MQLQLAEAWLRFSLSHFFFLLTVDERQILPAQARHNSNKNEGKETY